MSVYRFQAMGTSVELETEEPAAAERAEKRFREIESVLSRFRPDSDLSRVNAASQRCVEVSGDLLAVLRWAEKLRAWTAGLVDVGVGRLVASWGYDRSFSDIADRPVVNGDVSRRPAPWYLDGKVLVREPGTHIDVGGIAKGWACDVVCRSAGLRWIGAGGDIASADPDLEVEIEDPWGEIAATVRVGIGGLATSSRVHRRWLTDAGPAHHLIDPRTGAPARTPVLMATAIADSAVVAEAAAKAILIQGRDGLAWAASRDGIRAALVIWEDGSVFGTGDLEVAA